jgi:hypothetical protein
MIDYFARWNSEAEAKQDAARLRQYFGTSGTESPDTVKDWYLNQFLPNVKVWRPSQDTFDNSSPPQVIHNYLTGWFGILALDHIEPVIFNDNSIAFVLNRDYDPLASPKNLVLKNNIGAIINDIAVSPIFAGSNYPMGGY